MRRREFIAGLGSVAAWPVAARAQLKLPVIGYLGAVSPNTPVRGAFLQGLKDVGFIEGENVLIEYRWADGQYDRLPVFAAELVEHRVAAILATGGMAPAIAARAATATIPIVFQGGGDPIRAGLVASLNRPGGNVTGALNLTTGAMDAKAVQFLRELVPAAASFGLLVNQNNPNPSTDPVDVEAAARALQWKLHLVSASTDGELDAAFATLAQLRAGALHVAGNTFFLSRRSQIVDLAARYAIPTTYPLRDYAIAGGLLSYGADVREPGQLAGKYVGRILKGEKPAELPVQQAVKVEMVVNLRTAKALGLVIPEPLLARADEVIE
jgi:putative tryptophan/tyrosine transport system substrate-binding protein